MTTAPAPYPPEQHLLRDLRFSFEHGENNTSRAWLPIVPELCADQGHARVGALATLVDVIGGGLAANAAAPDWIATADLTIHLVRGADHVPVDLRRQVAAPGLDEAEPECEVHRAADLLVEEDVPGEPVDLVVQAEGDLAEHPCAVVPEE